MAFAINEEAAKQQQFLNVMRPQEVARQKPDGTWEGTLSQGLPVKAIPHFEFPKVVYKHPKKPFKEIIHRNDRFEVVSTDLVPTEHLTKHIHCAAHKNGGPKECPECQKELKAALAKGWVEQPYIPQAPPTVEDDIYGKDDDEDLPAVLSAPVPKRSTRGTKENPL